MTRKIFIFLFFVVCCFMLPLKAESYATTSGYTQSSGRAAVSGSYNAVALSMVTWGVGMAVGIAVLAAVIKQSSSSSHSH